VLSAVGNHFSAGLDLKLASEMLDLKKSSAVDPARKAIQLRKSVWEMQEAFNQIENCGKPVIAAIRGACIGGGVDMISACDVRFASADAFFSVKEVDIGLAADLGSIQRLSKLVGNHSWLREVVFTARKISAQEALQFGLVSRIFPDHDSLVKAALDCAKEIASKSPVAVHGSKVVLNHARDHNVKEGLEFVLNWNMAMLQTEDTFKAIESTLKKTTPTFSKL
jgi:delta(3,5)-delta(2,4)-dienoyl-CoA isomerase